MWGARELLAFEAETDTRVRCHVVSRCSSSNPSRHVVMFRVKSFQKAAGSLCIAHWNFSKPAARSMSPGQHS